MSPTEKSLALLRDLSYFAVDVTAYGHPKAAKFPRKKDLLGFIDILAFRPNELLAVQTTNASNVANHVRKYRETCLPLIQLWLKAGCHFVIHGWTPEEKDECRTVSAYMCAGEINWEG